jgi:hypothetical protein
MNKLNRNPVFPGQDPVQKFVLSPDCKGSAWKISIRMNSWRFMVIFKIIPEKTAPK